MGNIWTTHLPEPELGYKICHECMETKEIAAFPKHKKGKDGLYSYCRSCANAKNRASHHANKKNRNLKSKRWLRKNRERQRLYQRKRYRELKDTVLTAYGNQCANCGFDDRRALCIDHVNGSGKQERDKITAAGVLRKIIRENFLPDYQILCANCNMIKTWTNDEIPYTDEVYSDLKEMS